MPLRANARDVNWYISPDLHVEQELQDRLHARFPVIKNTADLSRILAGVSLKVPSSSLSFEYEGDAWRLGGKRAPVVTSIDFEFAPLALLPSLKLNVSHWIGQVHTEQLKARVAADVDHFLRRSGYLNAAATVLATGDESEVLYKVSLNIGDPCVITGYVWPTTLPRTKLPVLDNGELCDETLAASSVEDIESKLRLRGYIQASLEFGGFQVNKEANTAKIIVRGTFGNRIAYQFIETSTGKDISSVLDPKDVQNLDPLTTGPDSVVYELLHALKNRGYQDAQINGPQTTRDSDELVTYTYQIQLGEQALLASLRFEGNERFSSQDLATKMNIERQATAGESDAEVLYNPDVLSSGMETIKNAYMKEGYWDVKLSDRVSPTSTAHRQRLQAVVTIDEGMRRVLGKVEVVGAPPSTSAEDIVEQLPLHEGDSFDRSVILPFQQAIRTMYVSEGYLYTAVKVETLQESNSYDKVPTNVKVTIDMGPRVKFGEVYVSGLIRTEQYVVLRELLFEPGDWYDPDVLNASRRALLRLGVFSSVIIGPLDPSDLDQKKEMLDLIIDVKEGPSKTVTFGPGWSSYYGMRYNIEGALTNIGGTGRQLFSRASFNQEKSQKSIGPRTLIGRSISAGYFEPHILDSQIDGTVSAAQSALSTDYAWALTRAGEVEFSHTLHSLVPGSKFSVFYGRKLNEEEGATEEVDAFLADTFRVGRTGTRFVIDMRNDAAWPTSGYTLNGELAWARYELGGDLRYFRWDISNNHYTGITNNLVLAFGVNLTMFQGVTRRDGQSADVLPASERLNAGGADSIRGFREHSLGPIVRRPSLDAKNNWDCSYTSSPTGGTRRILLKAELRYRFTESVAGTSFIDSGNTSFTREEMAKFSDAFSGPVDVKNPADCPDQQPKRSIEDNIGYDLADLPTHPRYLWDRHFTTGGLALNFLTPIGSINLAYGVPWHEPRTDQCIEDSSRCFFRAPQDLPWWRRGEVHFNVGAKF